MNMLAQLKQTEQSMTSLEIADLVKTEHRNVKLSIERLVKNGVIQQSPLAKVENKQSLSPNRFSEVYIFSGEEGKLDSITVVAQLCPQFTAVLVKRWYELEKNNVVNLDDPSQLRSVLLNYAEQNIQLKSANEVLEKTIDNITATENGVKFQQACKILNIKQADLAKWLRDHNWDRYINKSRASTHYSQKLGYCETKFEEVDGVKPSGQPYNYTKIEFFILPKGMSVLAKHFGGAQ